MIFNEAKPKIFILIKIQVVLNQLFNGDGIKYDSTLCSMHYMEEPKIEGSFNCGVWV